MVPKKAEPLDRAVQGGRHPNDVGVIHLASALRCGLIWCWRGVILLQAGESYDIPDANKGYDLPGHPVLDPGCVYYVILFFLLAGIGRKKRVFQGICG